MRILMISTIIATTALSGCLKPPQEGPTTQQQQDALSSCTFEQGVTGPVRTSVNVSLGLTQSSKVTVEPTENVTQAQANALNDCISRSMIAAGLAEPEALPSAHELRLQAARNAGREANRFCPVGAGVLYAGASYCVDNL